MKDSIWCRWHHPDLEKQRAEWRRKGGEERSNAARAKKQFQDAALTNTEIVGLLSLALTKLAEGRAEPGVVVAMATVGKAITQIRNAGELEDRIRSLEEQAGITHIDRRRTA